VKRIASYAHRAARELPAIHDGHSVAQRVGRDIEREALAAEAVGQHVAGVLGIGVDFEEGRDGADELAVLFDHSAELHVFAGLVGQDAFGFSDFSSALLAAAPAGVQLP
jgi:hypothetical protein